jgi:hypothetical protein
MEDRHDKVHQSFRVEAHPASARLPVAHTARVTLEASVLKACSCHAYLPELAPSSGLLEWYVRRRLLSCPPLRATTHRDRLPPAVP